MAKSHIARHCRTNALVCLGLSGDMRCEGTVNACRSARNIMLDRVPRTIECSGGYYPSQARQEAEAEKESLHKQQRSKVRPNPVLHACRRYSAGGSVEYGRRARRSIFIGGRERPLLSKRDGRKHYRQRVCAEPSTGVQVSMSAEELKRIQETDRTLEIIRRAVLKQQSENGVSFVEKEGLIYHVVRAPLSRMGESCIPENSSCCRCSVGNGYGVGA